MKVNDAPANERQVGGDHYRKIAQVSGAQQHWDRMWDLYREAWFVGNITKYVERYRSKDGVQDLEKARHYLDKLIELEKAGMANTQQEVDKQGTCDHEWLMVQTEVGSGRRCSRCNKMEGL